MHQTLFTSQALKEFNQSELFDLVQKAQVYNASHGITGMIIYEQGVFTEVLEGEKEELEILMNKILQDKRHHQIRVVRDIPVESRHYQEWLMGFYSGADDKLIKL